MIVAISHKCLLTRISNFMIKYQAKYRDHIVNRLLKYWRSQNNHALRILDTDIAGQDVTVRLTDPNKVEVHFSTYRKFLKDDGIEGLRDYISRIEIPSSTSPSGFSPINHLLY
jgi:hypothetical protein